MNKAINDKIILGVDPGLQVTGFGVLKKELGKAYLLESGFLKMSPSKPLPERINKFHDYFEDKTTKFGVTDLSLETPFLGKNAQNFLKLGYLRGILYLLANKHNLKIHEFSPREIKATVTGFGGASKEQVARVMLQFFPGLNVPDKLDVSDALAITLCGLWHKNF